MFSEEPGIVDPDALVLLGTTPARALAGASFILVYEHGEWFDSRAPSRLSRPTIPPTCSVYRKTTSIAAERW